MAEVSALLIVILIIVIVVAIILIAIVFTTRRTVNVTSTSTPTVKSCTNPPVMPTGVVITNPQGDLLVVTWNLLASTDSYTVYIGTSPGFPTGSALNSSTVKTNSASFGNLAVGVPYYIKLVATNSCGTSPLSAESTFTIPFNFPPRFVVTYSQNNSLEMCWDDNVFVPTFQESASTLCDTTTSWMNYHSSDMTIRLNSDPTRCLTRTNVNQVWMNPCVPDTTQTWIYNNSDLSLCDPANPTADCLIISNVTNFSGDIRFGPKGSESVSGWNISQV